MTIPVVREARDVVEGDYVWTGNGFWRVLISQVGSDRARWFFRVTDGVKVDVVELDVHDRVLVMPAGDSAA